MDAELYIVPVGMVEEQIVTTVEVYIPDLLLIVAPNNSSIIDDVKEAEERYEELKKIGDIEIPDEDKAAYEKLRESLQEKSLNEEECLSQLDPVISEVVQKFQSEPQIHIPTAGEASEVLGEPGGSGIIFEG